jgi:hypothetical protein
MLKCGMRKAYQDRDSKRGVRRLVKIAAAIALLAGLGACSSDQMTRLVGTSMRSWCENTPDHCSVSADSR